MSTGYPHPSHCVALKAKCFPKRVRPWDDGVHPQLISAVLTSVFRLVLPGLSQQAKRGFRGVAIFD